MVEFNVLNSYLLILFYVYNLSSLLCRKTFKTAVFIMPLARDFMVVLISGYKWTHSTIVKFGLTFDVT